jgi:hypothetical protein
VAAAFRARSFDSRRKYGRGRRGRFSAREAAILEEMAAKNLKTSAEAGPRHIFISFSTEDLDEVNLLRGQAKNERSSLEFDDYSLHEPFNSENAEYIRQGLREKIRLSSVTVVYLTSNSADSSWVDWEIRESIKLGKGVVGMYKGDRPPSRLPGALVEAKAEIVPWKHKELTDAINRASSKR